MCALKPTIEKMMMLAKMDVKEFVKHTKRESASVLLLGFV